MVSRILSNFPMYCMHCTCIFKNCTFIVKSIFDLGDLKINDFRQKPPPLKGLINIYIYHELILLMKEESTHDK